MPLFRSSTKSPKEVVSELRETLLHLTQPAAAQTSEGKRTKKHKSRGAGRKHEQSDADLTKAAGEECAALLTSLKSILLADVAVDMSQLDEAVKQCYDAEVLLHLVRASVLEELPSPEARRDVVRIFRYFLERQTDNTVKYIIKNQALISNLINGYESGKPQVVANCGLMLRACSRYKSLVWVILLLKSDDVLQFFDFMQSKQFEVLSDAFVTFKELLRHDDLTAKFLEENHEEIFQRLSEVLSSDFYITKHVCLEWLQELLTESNSIREYYYSSAANLKTVMTLLGSDPSVTIRFKALDLMQGFLTITEKEREVREILLVNREKLNDLVVELLTKFDKDEKHCPEPGRKFLLKTLEDPELSPALSELIPVEIHINEEELHDHQLQPEPPQETQSELPPVKMTGDQNEPEPPIQDEKSPAQPQNQQQLVHDTADEKEKELHDDKQTREQEQLNEHQQEELETKGHLEDQPDHKEQLQAEKPNECHEDDSKTKESLASQPNEEQLQPSKDGESEEQPNEYHQDDFDQPESKEDLVDQPNEEELQAEKSSKDSESEEKQNEFQEDNFDQSKVKESLADQPDEEQPQTEKSSKDTEPEEQPNEYRQNDSDQPETKEPLVDEEQQPQTEKPSTDSELEEKHHQDDSERKEHLAVQPDEEQPQTEESNKDANQPETEGPLPSHSEVEKEEESLTEQPFEQKSDPSNQPEVEENVIEQPNNNAEVAVEEPLLLHSELTSHEHLHSEPPLEHYHEGEEHLSDQFDQQDNEETIPPLSDSQESLPDQLPENEIPLANDMEGPAEPLPDVEELLPNQINGDTPDGEQPQTEESNKDANQPETEGPLPSHSEVEKEEESLTEQPFEQKSDPSNQPEVEENIIEQPNNNAEVEEPLLLHSELTSHEKLHSEPPLEHYHEDKEHLSDQFDQQDNEETSPPLSDSRESLPDQLPENEIPLANDMEGPAEPLPDVEELLPNQINGDTPQEKEESLPDHPSENETTPPDHIEGPAEPWPNVEEPLLNQQNEDNKESLPDQPEDETTLLDHTENMEQLPKTKEPSQNEQTEELLLDKSEDETTPHDRIECTEPLPDHEEESSPSQQKEGKPENEEQLSDHPDQNMKNEEILLEYSKLSPAVEEELPPDQRKEPLLEHSDQTEEQQPSQNQHKEHSDKPEGEGASPEEQLVNLNLSDQSKNKESDTHEDKNQPPTVLEDTEVDLPGQEEEEPLTEQPSEKSPPPKQLEPDMLTLESSHEQPTAITVDLPNILEQLQEILSIQPDAAQQFDDSTMPDHPSEVKEQQFDDSTKPDHPSETQEQHTDESTKPDYPCAQEQQTNNSTKPSEMQEQQLNDFTAPDHPGEMQGSPSSADKKTETPEELLIKPSEEEMQQLSVKEPQHEHQVQLSADKQDCTNESSKQEQLPQDNHQLQLNEQEDTKEHRKQDQQPESELLKETREILVD